MGNGLYPQRHPRQWAAFAAFALFGFVLGYGSGTGSAGYRVDQVVPFSLLMPVVGVLSGMLLLGER